MKHKIIFIALIALSVISQANAACLPLGPNQFFLLMIGAKIKKVHKAYLSVPGTYYSSYYKGLKFAPVRLEF